MPDCTTCPLKGRVVWGTGPSNARVMLVGEAPGKLEAKLGVPFVGPSGRELDNYLKQVGLSRENCWVDNVVKVRPANDRDPTAEEIAVCSRHLAEAMREHKPQVIGALGAVATRWLLGSDVTLELVHGIPQRSNRASAEFADWVVVPMYHPAFGLHATKNMVYIQQDFEALVKVVRGELGVGGVKDEWPDPNYYTIEDNDKLHYSDGAPVVAIDTETVDGEPWCLSVSVAPGRAAVVMADQTVVLGRLNRWLYNTDKTVLLHNALFDLPVLAKMGIHPAKVVDSMVAAYLLGDVSQALKVLAYRLCGVEMKDYQDMVRPATRVKAIDYLERVEGMDWPTPDPVLEWVKKKGADSYSPHVKQPQNIKRKVRAILKAVEVKDANPWERWHSIKVDEGRGQVEAVCGAMVPGFLSDIPLEQAVHYSARDADATFRVWPILWQRIVELGLEKTFALDMATIPMITDMMDNGMAIDAPHFQQLSVEYGVELARMGNEISGHNGYAHINPGSWQQVGHLLFNKLGLKRGKLTKGKTGPSTDNEVLEGLRDAHPVVPLILDYREKAKLKGTYIDPLPKWADENGRVHTTLRTTRTETGRLSSANPNQQNIPQRSEEGRRVRDGFVVGGGNVLLSLDFSQIEMRVEAHTSNDENLRGVFVRGADIHTYTAAKVFGVLPQDVDEDTQRYPCKRVGFGVLYGISAERLLLLLEQYGTEGWDLPRCEGLIDEWFALYPGVRAHMEAVSTEARRYGSVRTPLGRMRLVPEVKAAGKYIVLAGLRQAGNMPAQGGAQDIIKQAMVDLTPFYRQFQSEGAACDPLIQIHDSLDFEVGEGIASTVAPVFKSVMETAVELSVPVVVDVKVGKRWGSMSKLEV